MINYNRFPDMNVRGEIIKALLNEHRSIGVFCAGQSLCGRKIYALRVGRNPCRRLICAGFHGSEYLTVLAALRFSQDLAAGCESGERHQGAVIVPCVNPDGTEIAIHGAEAACRYKPLVIRSCDDTSHWQANARGVDINRNFAACWCLSRQKEIELGINGPAPTRFGGRCPESEPETRALTRLCRGTEFDRVIALHSQGREIYYSFDCRTPKRSLEFALRLAKVSGYKAAQPEALASFGGFKDWFIHHFGKMGFTVEMGLGKNPLPLSDFEKEYPAVSRLLFEFIEPAKANSA